MRHLALRFRGLLRGGTVERLDIWLNDAGKCGIYGMRRFVRTLRQDIEAVRNAVLASVDLLRARMMPLRRESLHRK
jgi:transposase